MVHDWRRARVRLSCPEYKVTAVEVSPSNDPTAYQDEYEAFSEQSRRIEGVEVMEPAE